VVDVTLAAMTTRAVVLARGLGTRMREHDPAAPLSPEQQAAADAGLKAMMPINGLPFLDYVLSALADAGITDVALVVAPDHAALAERYTAIAPPTRVRVSFVVQETAAGTANAILSAQAWAGRHPFLAMNADNLYPTRALRDLASLPEPGFPAFDADDLVRSSNIPAERVRAFALVEVDDEGYLARIVEKPGKDHSVPVASAFRRKNLISMNCWRFDERIFEACRDVPRSARGEFELPEAVGLAASRGVRFKAVPARGPVLDLSRRADAADVAERLATVIPTP
jgi:glucose-1-phosphate thymidylyltransferase